MTDLKAIEYTLKTGKTIPPIGCADCHYYSKKYEHYCRLLQTKKEVSRCIKNDFKSGIKSIYLKK